MYFHQNQQNYGRSAIQRALSWHSMKLFMLSQGMNSQLTPAQVAGYNIICLWKNLNLFYKEGEIFSSA